MCFESKHRSVGGYEQCDIGGLQDLLDGWCKDQTGTTTYYPAYKQYVLINWDEFEGE